MSLLETGTTNVHLMEQNSNNTSCWWARFMHKLQLFRHSRLLHDAKVKKEYRSKQHHNRVKNNSILLFYNE